MKRLIISLGIFIAIVIAGVILMQTIGPWRHRSINDYSDTEITTSIKNRLSKDRSTINTENVSIQKKEPYLDTWLITKVQFDNEPAESESRLMVCVFNIKDRILQLIAYSGDGFSADSFPSDAPDALLEKANQP
jgi:hypothetical protein